ncbi:MAG: right-handed parallel beta-helix repeat-containing protein [Promethearchaeota archaeon]
MSRGKGIFVFMLCLILLLGSFTWLLPVSTEYEKSREDFSRPMSPSGYTQHDPIVIMNDSALAFYAVSGNGNAGSPYILEGWNITTENGHGISIYGTTKYFVVRDCWLSGIVSSIYRGVEVNAAADGTAVIERIHCESWYAGIDVSSSPGIVVKGCYLKDCDYGLMIGSSNNSTVFNNTALECNDWGLWISSTSVTVANNTLCDNAHGLLTYYAYNVTLENNTLSDDGFFFLFDNIADYEAISEKNNAVNGLPLTLLINKVGTIYNGGFGQVVLINCTGVKLSNLNLSYCESGAFLRWCTDCEIRDSFLEHNDDSGLYALYSNSTIVENVSISGNAMYGLQLNHCTVNVTECDIVENKRGVELAGSWGELSIQNNRFVNNTDYGLIFSFGWNVSVTGNTFTEDGIFCAYYEPEAYHSYSKEVVGNLVNGKPLVFYDSLHDVTISSPHGQIFLFNCSNVVLSSLDCSHTVIGIGIGYSNSCSIINSDCSFAKQMAVDVVSSNFTLVQNVNCVNAGGTGIRSVETECTSLIDNRCGGGYYGINFFYSQFGLLKGNIATGNRYSGIQLINSEDTDIYNNTCNFNLAVGIYAESSSGLIIVNNTCNSNSGAGIYLFDSYESVLHGNDCELNSGSGLVLQAWTCTITSNRFLNNKMDGLDVFGGFELEISWNTILSNDGYGVRMGCSDSRFIHNILALNDDYGAHLSGCNNVTVHHNMFVNNNGGGAQAYDQYSSEGLWYDLTATEGNYWSDWDGIGPYYVEGNSGSCDIYPLGEVDTDSDTLPDSWEISNGLNPNSPDSDSDTLPDAWEVMYGLNPLADDTTDDLDDDGISNIDEYRLGLNPASGDSDGDLMPDLWEVQNYLNPLFNDASFDPDGDGMSNLSEYYGGTNPHVYNGPSTSITVTTTLPDGALGNALLISAVAIGSFSVAIVLVILYQKFSSRGAT